MCEVCRLREQAMELAEDVKVARAKESAAMTRWTNCLKRGEITESGPHRANAIDYRMETFDLLEKLARLDADLPRVMKEVQARAEAEGGDEERHSEKPEGVISMDDFMKDVGMIEVEPNEDGMLNLGQILRAMKARGRPS